MQSARHPQRIENTMFIFENHAAASAKWRTFSGRRRLIASSMGADVCLTVWMWETYLAEG